MRESSCDDEHCLGEYSSVRASCSGRVQVLTGATAQARLTVAQVLEQYLERISAQKKPASQRSDRNACKHLCRALGDRLMHQLVRREVQEFRDKLQHTPAAANRALSVLSHAWTLASGWGWVQGVSPVAGVPRFPEKVRDRHLSDEEYGRFLRAVSDARAVGEISRSAEAAVVLLALSGMRLHEVLRLQWVDVDIPNQVLRLKDSKTGPRAVALSAPCASTIQLMQPAVGPWVFPGQRAGQPLTDIRRPWSRILLRAGIGMDLTRHGLRHSFVSKGMRLGLPLTDLAHLCGHSSSKTTERYAHVGTDHAVQASGRIADGILATMVASHSR